MNEAAVLDEKQRPNKFRNLLHAMSKRDQTIVKSGGLHKGRWVLSSSKDTELKTNSRQTQDKLPLQHEG